MSQFGKWRIDVWVIKIYKHNLLFWPKGHTEVSCCSFRSFIWEKEGKRLIFIKWSMTLFQELLKMYFIWKIEFLYKIQNLTVHKKQPFMYFVLFHACSNAVRWRLLIHFVNEPKRVLSPRCSKTNLLILGCCEGKCIYCKASSKECGQDS